MWLYKPEIASHPEATSTSPFSLVSSSLIFAIVHKMKGVSGLRSLSLALIVAILVWSSSIDICNARKGRHWRQRTASTAASLSKKKGKSGHHHGGGSSGHGKPSPPPALSPVPAPEPAPAPPGSGPGDGYSNMFDVLNFGAKGDGTTDDTKVIIRSLFTMIINHTIIQ